MLRTSPIVIEANLIFHPAVHEEENELTRAMMASERAGASSLDVRGGMAAWAEAMQAMRVRK
jgi:hypothetical protein